MDSSAPLQRSGSKLPNVPSFNDFNSGELQQRAARI
jgi:hypothetical protein